MSNVRTKYRSRMTAFLIISELVRDFGDEEAQHAWRVICETEPSPNLKGIHHGESRPNPDPRHD